MLMLTLGVLIGVMITVVCSAFYEQEPIPYHKVRCENCTVLETMLDDGRN